MRSTLRLIALLTLGLFLAACSTQLATSSVTAGWLDIPVLDVKTNKQISFADYPGKTVIVEGMAVWCGVCFYQESQAAQALGQLNRDDVVYISLDLDPSGEAPLLAEYAAKNHFNWTFVRSSADLMKSLIAQFGRAVTVPDNIPIFFVSPAGRVSDLYTGGQTTSQLIELIKQWSQK